MEQQNAQSADQIITDLETGAIDAARAGPELHRIGYGNDKIWRIVQFITERRALAGLGDGR